MGRLDLLRLSDLTSHLGITAWDLLIVGDGSGSNWAKDAGWASVLIDAASGARKLFHGGMSPGTVTLGELFPYLHALTWYVSKDGPGRERRKAAAALGRPLLVHVVSDSQTVVAGGNKTAARRTHRHLWAAMDALAADGLSMTYHHVKRDVVALNLLVDEVSRKAREAMTGVWDAALEELRRRKVPGIPKDATIYDFSS